MLIILREISDERNELLSFLDKNKVQYKIFKFKNEEFMKIESDDLSLSEKLKRYDTVKEIISTKSSFPLISKKNSKMIIKVRDVEISSDTFSLIAGPCTIENREDLLKIAEDLKKRGIKIIRGGTYKLRTSPYHFSGLGDQAIDYLEEVRELTGLVTVSEITCSDHIENMSKKIDILQVGTRNMQNYALLEKLGEISNPIILKRGMANTIEEWLLAAERIVLCGNPNVILCERGIRTFENFSRNTLDIAVIPAIKELTNLPLIVDPSHSAGDRNFIKAVSWGAIAAGADGLIIETHYQPEKAICDSRQTINYSILDELMKPLPMLLKLWGKQ